MYDRPVEVMRAEMEALAAKGHVHELPVRGGEFWTLRVTRPRADEYVAAEAIV